MLRNRLITGVAVLVLLGASAGCAVDLERTVEEAIVVSEQLAEEMDVDLEQPAGETATFTIKGWVTVDAYHYDAATGTYIHFYHDESSNVITTIGIDFIAQQLGGAVATNPAKWISLSNDGSSLVTWTELPGELDNTNGMGRTGGDYAHTLGANTYTVVATFTATGAVTVQTTGLQWTNVLQSDTNLMAANDFTSVVLAGGDSLLITWELTLSGV